MVWCSSGVSDGCQQALGTWSIGDVQVTGHVLLHPARVGVDDGLLRPAAVVPVGEGAPCQPHEDETREAHSGWRSWCWSEQWSYLGHNQDVVGVGRRWSALVGVGVNYDPAQSITLPDRSGLCCGPLGALAARTSSVWGLPGTGRGPGCAIR